MPSVPFSWMYADPALIADRLISLRERMAAEEVRLKELARRNKARRIRKLTKLAKAGFYDGIVFHRVIEGFMAQTGDPTGTGMGSSEEPDIAAEFTQEPFKRGTVGMARSQDPNSGNSQFFVMFADGDFLNGQYTVWGQVDEVGMACVDKIERGEPPANPDKMTKVTVE